MALYMLPVCILVWDGYGQNGAEYNCVQQWNKKKTMGPILNKSQLIGLTSQVGNALITFIL